MKCSKCGFENKDNSKFCLKCGNRMMPGEKIEPQNQDHTISETLDNTMQQSAISENSSTVSDKKMSEKFSSGMPVIIGAAAVAVISIGVGVTVFFNNRTDNDIAVFESTDGALSVQSTAEILETAQTDNSLTVSTAQTSMGTAEYEALNDVSSYDFNRHNDSSVHDDTNTQYDWLVNVSSMDYSLYDVFTDVDAVAHIVAEYSNGMQTYEEIYYNCYYYGWFFEANYSQTDDLYFSVCGPGYIEAPYIIHIPIDEVEQYLKKNLTHNLIPDSNEIYQYYNGNTEGNYANFSAVVCEKWLADPGGIIYCGGDDYTSWKVRSSEFDFSDDSIVVNDLSDMVLYEDYGDFAYIYYRNSGEDCALYRVLNNGTERKKLTEKRASNVRLYGDYIYYSSDKKFWRMNKDGSGKTKIIDAYCYLPSFYNNMIYCISPDDSCLDIYDINGGSVLDHLYLDNRPLHIDNFFIQDSVLIARGYYTDIDEPFVIIKSMEDPNVSVKYSVNCGGINADEDYIYFCYDDNGTVRLTKTPLREFTNLEATWNYEASEMINSYFYVIEYDAHKCYIYQADYDGLWHRFELN